MLSYGPLVTSAVAGQQLHGSISMGNALDSEHCGSLVVRLLCKAEVQYQVSFLV